MDDRGLADRFLFLVANGCAAGVRLLPASIAALLLFVSGTWWTGAILAWMFWERHFETPGRHAQRLAERGKPKKCLSTLADLLLFGLPAEMTLGLALDGLIGPRVIFYAPG